MIKNAVKKMISYLLENQMGDNNKQSHHLKSKHSAVIDKQKELENSYFYHAEYSHLSENIHHNNKF